MSLEKNTNLSIVNDVVVYNDVLFLYQKDRAQRQFQLLMGEELLPEKSITNFSLNMESNNRIARRQGFKYKHIIFPSKPLLYKRKFKDIGIDLNPIFSKKHIHENVFYPELSADDYFLQDTHINIVGMIKLLGYLLEDLGYESLPEQILTESYIIGDLGNMANIKRKERVSVLKGFENLPNSRIEYYSLDSYLKNTNGQMSFRFNPSALFNERIVLFGTSSFNTRLDVYQKLFTEVIFIRSPYIIEHLISALEPDIVLTSNAERHLFNVPSSQESTPWFLNYITPNFDTTGISKDEYIAFKALFSGRKSNLYTERFGRRLSNLPRNLDKVERITQSDINSLADVFFIRDMAIHLEKTDLKLAEYLMSLAHKARPEGKLIKSKVEHYKNQLSRT